MPSLAKSTNYVSIHQTGWEVFYIQSSSAVFAVSDLYQVNVAIAWGGDVAFVDEPANKQVVLSFAAFGMKNQAVRVDISSWTTCADGPQRVFK